MTSIASKAWDMLRLIRRGGPALCQHRSYEFVQCSLRLLQLRPRKVASQDLRWIDADQFGRALDILHKRGVRYISFFGGETLLHPRLADMIEMSVARDMGPAVITNGWLLPMQLDRLASAGLKTVYISIDAACDGRPRRKSRPERSR